MHFKRNVSNTFQTIDMATQAYTEANTTANGELRWQYKVGENYRTCSDSHSRSLTTAHELGQTSLQLYMKRKKCECLATWNNQQVLSNINAGGFAKLNSLKEIPAKENESKTSTSSSSSSSKFSVHNVAPSDCTSTSSSSKSSAGSKLKKRQSQRKAKLEAERGLRHQKARTDHTKDKEQWAQKLQEEDEETKAARAALILENKTAASKTSSREEGPSDKRSRRVNNGFLYAAGVQKYRKRQQQSQHKQAQHNQAQHNQAQHKQKTSNLAQVLVRARPLFSHEAENGEWDSITIDSSRKGVVVHESIERIKGNHGLVKCLRHHQFQTEAVTTDDELYTNISHLPNRAVQGGRATLFCYGMTGSGKTYSMDSIHERLPADLFSSIDSVKFSAYELLGKRCVDMLPSTAPSTATPRNEVFLRVDKKGVTRVCGVTEHEAFDAKTLQQLLASAVSRRETSATGANATSSRSHAVYSLSFPNCGGQLTLIDLAGSEGNHETLYHSAKHTAEAKEINNSLATLRACLKARSGKSKTTHAPYRESILTRVLKDALTDPAASATLLACVSPACTHFEHSLRTVRTAMFLTGGNGGKDEQVEEEILTLPKIREDGPKKWCAKQLQEWIELQSFGEKIIVPKEMNGKQILKLSKSRLKGMCGDDMEVAELLFVHLRKASKESAKKALQARQEQLKGKKTRTSAAGFAKVAAVNPTAVGE